MRINGKSVEAEATHLVGKGVVVGGEDAAFARGDVLDGVQREDRGVAAAHFSALVLRADGVRGVFQDWNATARAHRADSVDINRSTCIVHRNHQLGAGSDGCVDRFSGGKQRVAVNINKDIARTAQLNHVGRGDPCHGRAHYFVARTDAHGFQRKVHEGGTA